MRSKLYFFITFFLLTVSNARAICYNRIGTMFLYTGYGFLFAGIIWSSFRSTRRYRRKYEYGYLIILSILLCCGIILQQLSVKRTMILLFTMFAVLLPVCVADNYIIKAKYFRSIAHGVIAGSICAMILSMIMGIPLVENAAESTLGIYLFYNGGIQDKNIATIMLTIICSLFICHRVANDKKNIDKIIMLLAFFVIIASNSRGAWIHTFIFMFLINYKSITKMDKISKIIIFFIGGVLAVLMIFFLYNNVFSHSGTYMYRVRGWTNYIKLFGNDLKIMLIGNGKIAYDQGVDYTIAVRAVTGWDGTLEIAWLNILIKNGFLGIIGFIIIFIRAFLNALKCKNYRIKMLYLSITMTLVVTSFVATYISNVHQLLGVFSYIVMSYCQGVINRKEYEGDIVSFLKQKTRGETYG